MLLIRLIRGLLATVFSLIWTLLWSMASIIGCLIGGEEKWANFVLRNWSAGILKSFNVEVRVKGQENLPEEGVIFVFNHTSYFDIPVFYTAIQKTARFGAKYELFRVPFFGLAMKSFDMMPIVRHQRDKVFDLYNRSIEKVRNGKSFILAAEGTRQKKDGVGDVFKSGPFIFAINGHLKICPVVMKGCVDILPRTSYVAGVSRWKYIVNVEVLKPVSTQGFEVETRKELMAQIQKEMKSSFASLAANTSAADSL